MKANKLDEVLKNLPDDVKSSGFVQEVSDNEKHLFHILEYKRTNNPEAQRYDLAVQVKKYQEGAWNLIKDTLPVLGYSNMYILHDPNAKAPVKKAPRKKAAPKTATKSEESKEA